MSAFNKRITLLKLAPVPRGEPQELARVGVWADVSDVGAVTKFTALSAGQSLSLTAVMWRREFCGFTHAEYGGRRYKIVQTGSAANPLHIKLFLERG